MTNDNLAPYTDLQLDNAQDQDLAPWWISQIAPQAFNIDPATGAYLGTCQADPSPPGAGRLATTGA